MIISADLYQRKIVYLLYTLLARVKVIAHVIGPILHFVVICNCNRLLLIKSKYIGIYNPFHHEHHHHHH